MQGTPDDDWDLDKSILSLLTINYSKFAEESKQIVI